MSKIGPEHLRKKALIYVRQSSPTQVQDNLESQRRQYGLVEVARGLGFERVDVIDLDLGRSGSGSVERPGFQRMVAEVCAGDVGAVFCIEASRLARNGRDWHHLIDLCALVGVVVVDPDGVYDPRLTNDRLLLGLKGTMSEFELSLLRQRSLEAIRSKARRGELIYCLPVGLAWTRDGRIELEPDLRVQEAVRLVFRKFEELGSVRQVLLWVREERIELPSVQYGEFGREIVWKLPIYNSVLSIVKNPVYAGAYVYGRRESRTRIVDGRARKSEGHIKPKEEWTVLIVDHHPGYISWQQHEANLKVLAENTHMKRRMDRRAGRGGHALLAGLLRCRRCGRMIHVAYSGTNGTVPRYFCRGANLNHGVDACISFGGQRVDSAVGREVLRAVEAPAIAAALAAAERAIEQERDARRALELELEQAKYQVRLAARRYEAVDPENRLVAGELEHRWNEALTRAADVEARLAATASVRDAVPSREVLLSLAHDLPALWDAPATEPRLKQRIVHLLVHEVVADVDADRHEVVIVVHWAGGRHSELRVKKNRTGQHSRCTDQEAVDVVRNLAGRWPDDHIASILNRLGLLTGAGNTWTAGRVAALRSYHAMPKYDPNHTDSRHLTLHQAAKRLGVSATVIRRMIRSKVLPATQVISSAPWQIAEEALSLPAVVADVSAVRSGSRRPRTPDPETQITLIPGS